MYLTTVQHDTLMKPLRASRVAKRSQGGKQLSYLEAWDVKAHLTRIFGFGNWDAEVTEAQFMGTHDYMGGSGKDKPMVEVVWMVRLRLTIRTYEGEFDPLAHLTTYEEAAVGSATGGREGSGIGDLHDNAIKQAASDALKRCAINLGTQFGLSLYDNGNTHDVVKQVLVGPPTAAESPEEKAKREEREAALTKTVGAGSKNDDAAKEELLARELGATPVEEVPVAPN
jgi:recombination DNA repair RAD52 pathway protein